MSPSALPDPLAPPAQNLLTPEHGLPDDLNSGFRRPDAGWVYGQGASFEGIDGGAMFSNFWFGPIDLATSFAAHLANDLSAYLPTLGHVVAQAGVLWLIAIVCQLVVYGGLALLAVRARGLLGSRPGVSQWLFRIVGVFLIGFAIWTAVRGIRGL